MKYTQVHDGDWIEPLTRKGHKIRCCDCGLVHVFNFRVKAGKLQYQAIRDPRATARRRKRVRP